MSALVGLVIGCIGFEVGAGQIIEHDIEVGAEQIAPAPFRELGKGGADGERARRKCGFVCIELSQVALAGLYRGARQRPDPALYAPRA